MMPFFLTITSSPAEPLSSWATSPKHVIDFMFGWDRPWVLIKKPAEELDIFLDLNVFNQEAHPFTRMTGQGEVIVKMPPTLFVKPDELQIMDWKRPS
jgi:hypothetical protein